jgi:NADPH:quinone reductase-like Zn-dependent oxidoreductase
MQMPKIVRFHQFGGPEVLKFDELPSQEPGPGEVRLRVQAIGMNRAESMYFHGQYLESAKLPSRLGYEAAGVVEAVGPGVDKSWLGKQVATVPAFSLNAHGVAGEEAVVPAAALGEYPAKLSPAEGSAIWMQYLTAYGALVRYAQVKKGDYVLITAASSSVGIAAIEIAKAEGAIAIAATRTSSKKKELIEAGADHVIAFEEEDLAARVQEITGGQGARIIFDPVGGPLLEKLAEAASVYGIIVEYGALDAKPTPYPLFTALAKWLTVRAYTLLEFSKDPEELAIAIKYINDRLEDGRFHIKIAKTFPFSQTAEAYRYLESNAQIGKIVITVP